MLVFLPVLYFAFQAFSLMTAAAPYTDEGVYAQAGRLIADGAMPHRDFLLVHPPMLSSFVALFSSFTDNYYYTRLAFLFLNVGSGAVLAVVVLQLARLFGVRLSPESRVLAVVVTLVTFYSFHEMTHHDFRFLALRQFCNVFFIFAFFFLLRAERLGGFGSRLMFLLCIWVAGLTFPVAVLLNLPLLAVLLFASGRRKQLTRQIVAACLLLAGSYFVYFLAIENSFEQLVMAQATRVRVDSFDRVAMLLNYAKNDLVLYSIAMASSVALLFNDKLRLLGAALVATAFLQVFAPNSFYPHYTVAAAPALIIAIGLAPFALQGYGDRLSWVTGAIFVLALFVHGSFSLPSLYREMRDNNHPDYGKVIARLRSTPQPVLAFEPIYVVEAGVKAVPHFHQADMRFLRVKGVNLSDSEYERLESAACTILIEPFFAEQFVPGDKQKAWRTAYESAFSNWWGTLLVTHHDHCKGPVRLD